LLCGHNSTIIELPKVSKSRFCPERWIWLTFGDQGMYQRRLADLPSTGQSVQFLLAVRKFFCDVPACPRKIFAERLAPFVAPWARVTQRLYQIVQIIGLTLPASNGMPRGKSEYIEAHQAHGIWPSCISFAAPASSSCLMSPSWFPLIHLTHQGSKL